MKDELQFLLQMSKEQREQRRQSESQRSTLTNILISISSGVVILIIHSNFSLEMIYLSVFLILVSIFGIIASLKYYERSRIHLKRASTFEKKICELLSDTEYHVLLATANNEHSNAHPFLSRFHQYWLWYILPMLFLILGIILTIIIIIKN